MFNAASLSGVAVRDDKGHALPALRFGNVTAHALGLVATRSDDKRPYGPYNATIVGKDAEIPAEGKDTFTTVDDNQSAVRLQLIQGEHVDPEKCIKVGEAAVLEGIPPQPRGVPKVEVTLGYDK